MGRCRYCGEPAGLFRGTHRACRTTRTATIGKIAELVDRYFGSDIEPQRFVDLLRQLGRQTYVDELTLQHAIKEAISRRIQIECTLPPRHDLERAAQLIKLIGLDDWSSMRLRLAQANILQHIDDGVLPGNVRVAGPMPLNLEAGERIVYIFNQVSRYSMHPHSQYVGGSSGISFRVARGVYYRIGSSRGRSIRTERMERDGIGDLVVTTKNVIFLANTGPAKIPAKRIVSVQTLSDGVVLIRDGSRAKSEVYTLNDPWFAGQLISRSGRMATLHEKEEADNRSDPTESIVNVPPEPSRQLPPEPTRQRLRHAWIATVVGLVIVLFFALVLGSLTVNQRSADLATPFKSGNMRVPEATASVPHETVPVPKPKPPPSKPLNIVPPAVR